MTIEQRATGPTLAERLHEPIDRRLGWSPALDGVRGIGVLLIMVFHYMGNYNFYLRGFPILVDLFFVLSGFLITTLLFEEREKRGRISVRDFYLRRAFRLFPALYALLTVFLVYLVLAGGDKRADLFKEFLAVAFYVYDFFIAYVGVQGQILVQLWTLSVEEQFYFLWPVIFITMMKVSKPKRLPVLITGMVALVILWPALRMTLANGIAPDDVGTFLSEHSLRSFMFGLSIMRPDSIILGCLAALLYRLEPTTLSPRGARLASISGYASFTIFLMAACLGWAEHFGPFVSVFANFAVLTLAFWVVDLVRRPDTPVAKALSHRVPVWFGKRSYGLYIWHMFALYIVNAVLTDFLGGRARLVVVVGFPIAFAVTIGLVMLSWKFIEMPALKAKKKYAR